jgi:nucleotide-binding universal stress UspA family protein
MPMLQKVLVATDLSEASRTPLGYAAALSRRLDASLTALYVSPRYASYEPFPAFPSQAALDPARRQGLEDEVRRFVESAAGPQPVEVVVRDGDPADEILGAAAESAFDLVVLGTHGRRGFERWSLGSVTDRVARRLERLVRTVADLRSGPGRDTPGRRRGRGGTPGGPRGSPRAGCGPGGGASHLRAGASGDRAHRERPGRRGRPRLAFDGRHRSPVLRLHRAARAASRHLPGAARTTRAGSVGRRAPPESDTRTASRPRCPLLDGASDPSPRQREKRRGPCSRN